MAKIKGRVALVTGASSGIGEATAQRLAAAGYKVYGTSRRGAQTGERSFAMLPLDVTSDKSVAAAVREVIRLEGRIDVLVNNAGFGVAPAGAEESSLDQARSIFDTNFFGLVRMTRAVVPHMRAQGSGRIINIGSVLGFLPMPYWRSMPRPSTQSKAIRNRSTMSSARGASGSPSLSLRTRRRHSTRTSLEPDSKRDEYREIRVALAKKIKEVVEFWRRPRRRSRRRAESCHRGSSEPPIHGRWRSEPPAIASQICARWRVGRRDSKGPAARRPHAVAVGSLSHVCKQQLFWRQAVHGRFIAGGPHHEYCRRTIASPGRMCRRGRSLQVASSSHIESSAGTIPARRSCSSSISRP